MYFWNVNALVQELKTGTLTEYEKMKYFLAMTLLQLFSLMNGPAFVQFMPLTNSEVLVQLLCFGVIVGVTVWGIYHCFIINKHGDNKNFIERIICLGFPIGVRIMVFFSIGMLISIIFAMLMLVLLPKTAYAATSTGSAIIDAVTMNKATLLSIRSALLQVQITQLIIYVVVSVIFYVNLGKRIAEVSQNGRRSDSAL